MCRSLSLNRSIFPYVNWLFEHTNLFWRFIAIPTRSIDLTACRTVQLLYLIAAQTPSVVGETRPSRLVDLLMIDFDYSSTIPIEMASFAEKDFIVQCLNIFTV